MGQKDPRVDAYIDQAPEYARPVLRHLRELVHTACPDVEEGWKWSMPHFLKDGILCSMAGFKNHCAFNIWRGELIFGEGLTAAGRAKETMGRYGRVRSLADLPPDAEILGHLHTALHLGAIGAKKKASPRPKAPAAELPVPGCVTTALAAHPAARDQFTRLSPSHRKEYIEWITEAKTDPTRQKRLATMVEWLTEGKSRNWKYQKC